VTIGYNPKVEWTPTAVTIRVNGDVVRRVSDPAGVPQRPLYARLHARSTEYNAMAEGAAFESFIEEFSYTPMVRGAKGEICRAAPKFGPASRLHHKFFVNLVGRCDSLGPTEDCGF
jgi:hypothetical protein